MNIEEVFITDVCDECTICLEICPVNAIISGSPYMIGCECILCGKCINVCPSCAIEYY